MSNKVSVKISPLPHYNKYASADYTLCSIEFDVVCNGKKHHFESESNSNCIKELLESMERFLVDESPSQTELNYYVPWIMGDQCVYPYSFEIDSQGTWSFRYKKNQNDKEFDFWCNINRDNIIAIQNALREQYMQMDWEALGKTELYTFEFSEKEFEWCYSATALRETLSAICMNRRIKRIYVSAANYEGPLFVDKNYVSYYVGAELIIQLDNNILIDLLLFAYGLVRWRIFNDAEYRMNVPEIRFIEDGSEEYCDIGDVYGMFNIKYTDSMITQIAIKDTDLWPWTPRGFDLSKAGMPIELPEAIYICLSNDHVLSLQAFDDDFSISLFENTLDIEKKGEY